MIGISMIREVYGSGFGVHVLCFVVRRRGRGRREREGGRVGRVEKEGREEREGEERGG